MEWKPIETAPKDGTSILVYAQWDWDGMDKERCAEPYAWQVCAWKDDRNWDADLNAHVGAFVSESFNPYKDFAVRPLYWVELFAPPIPD